MCFGGRWWGERDNGHGSPEDPGSHQSAPTVLGMSPPDWFGASGSGEWALGCVSHEGCGSIFTPMCRLGCGSRDPGCGIERGRTGSFIVSPRIQTLLGTGHQACPTSGLRGHVCYSWATCVLHPRLSCTSSAPSKRCEGQPEMGTPGHGGRCRVFERRQLEGGGAPSVPAGFQWLENSVLPRRACGTKKAEGTCPGGDPADAWVP